MFSFKKAKRIIKAIATDPIGFLDFIETRVDRIRGLRYETEMQLVPLTKSNHHYWTTLVECDVCENLSERRRVILKLKGDSSIFSSYSHFCSKRCVTLNSLKE